MLPHDARKLYTRKSLSQALAGIWEYPLTVVEAPMGYGKTTAVKEFLNNSDDPVLWQTLADSSASGFWRGFCRMLKKLDAGCADRLAELGVPTDSVFMDAALELIGGVEFPARTAIVFDDFHLLASQNIEQFVERLVKTVPPNLHIIIVSRTAFGENTTELALKGFCQVIGKSSFEFSQDEIVAYYKQCGIRLRPEEATELYAYTEGWVSALYLSLLNFAREGRVERQASLAELIEKTVYRQCPETVKEFLLTICVFDSFTLAQAKAMWPQGNAEVLVRYLMTNNAFIKFDRYNQTYHVHNIFTGYLREQQERQGPERRQAVQRAAGSWYAGSGDYIQAMDCFYQAGDFEELLLAFELDNGHSINSEHWEKIMQYFSACPEEAKSKHPVAYLIYARKFFMLDTRDRYAAECQKAGEYIEAVHDEKTKNHLLGELELTKSFAKYNDLRGMVEHQAKAYALLDGPSRLFDHKNFFTFCSSSILYMFFRQSGLAEEAVNLLTEFMPRYCLITSGHGAGAEYVVQAEWLFHRGDVENAGIIIHKAFQPAQSNRQIDILLCALFLQVRLAFVDGDLPAVWKLLRQMRAAVEEYGQYQVVHTVDMCEGFIHAHLGQERKIPAWITDGKLQESRLYFPGHAFFNIVYGKALLAGGQYLKLLGLTGQFLDVAGVFPNLLGQIYTYIYAAVAYHRLKRREEARDTLRQAAAIAAPDQFILPFVENGDEIGPILGELETEECYAEFAASVKAAYAAFTPRLAAMRAAGQPGDAMDSLTPREREVAGLVADGLSNQAIAKQLIVEETTVKKTLQNIYAKLGIGGRTMLARLIIEQK